MRPSWPYHADAADNTSPLACSRASFAANRMPAPRLPQTGIACSILRVGTSRGLFFRRTDLAADHQAMREQLRSIVGAGSPRGIDGLGALDPLANKLAVVERARTPGADLDFWFAQVGDLRRGHLDESVSCGNMLAGVGPFALEAGLLRPVGEPTWLRIRSINTGQVARAAITAPGEASPNHGDPGMPRVPGAVSDVELDYATSAPLSAGEIFPGERRLDVVDGIEYTLVCCTTPLLIARAHDFGLGFERAGRELDEDQALLRCLDRFRRKAARRSGLGEVGGSLSPGLALIARDPARAQLHSRYFSGLACHPAHPVNAALALAVAARCRGTLAHTLAPLAAADDLLRIAHPGGVMDVGVRVRETPDRIELQRLSVRRSTRTILQGRVWPGP